MSRVSQRLSLNPQPSYRDWRAAALKALEKRNKLAVTATRESILTRAYVQGLSPEDAAEGAAREYDATLPAARIKRRR